LVAKAVDVAPAVGTNVKVLRVIPSVFLEDLTINLAIVILLSAISTDSLGVTADSEIVTDPAETILIFAVGSEANPASLPSLSDPLITRVGAYVSVVHAVA
jgi:hypothetical protein